MRFKTSGEIGLSQGSLAAAHEEIIKDAGSIDPVRN